MVKESDRRISADAAVADEHPFFDRGPEPFRNPVDRQRDRMPTAERIYLVPCDCSERIRATAGQAGERLACPACGRGVDVPRFRDLTACECERPATLPRATHWDAGRGLLLAGIAGAVVSATLAVSLVRVGSLFFAQPPELPLIRDAVAKAPLTDIQAAWQSLARTGVRRPATQDEHRLEQFARTTSGVVTLLWVLAGVGTATALAGVAMLMTAGARSGSHAETHSRVEPGGSPR
jgi:hypothetical protein